MAKEQLYQPRLMFLKASRVMADGIVPLKEGDVEAKRGDYKVTFPNGSECVMGKDFFETFYETATALRARVETGGNKSNGN